MPARSKGQQRVYCDECVARGETAFERAANPSSWKFDPDADRVPRYNRRMSRSWVQTTPQSVKQPTHLIPVEGEGPGPDGPVPFVPFGPNVGRYAAAVDRMLDFTVRVPVSRPSTVGVESDGWRSVWWPERSSRQAKVFTDASVMRPRNSQKLLKDALPFGVSARSARWVSETPMLDNWTREDHEMFAGGDAGLYPVQRVWRFDHRRVVRYLIRQPRPGVWSLATV